MLHSELRRRLEEHLVQRKNLATSSARGCIHAVQRLMAKVMAQRCVGMRW